MIFQKCPLSLFSHIRKYFVTSSVNKSKEHRESLQDWRNFCNCSKGFFAEIKKCYAFYNLTPRLSLAYVRYCENEEGGQIEGKDKSIIVGLMSWCVSRSDYQIGLSFDCFKKFRDSASCISVGRDVYEIICNEADDLLFELSGSVTALTVSTIRFPGLSSWMTRSSFSSSLRYLSVLEEGEQVITNDNLRLFSHLEVLSVKNSRISDVKCLSNIKTLAFWFCRSVVDVSPLRNVYELFLVSCSALKDVSCLGKVHKLNISYCENVKDVSSLGSVYHLSINACGGIEDISMLGIVSVLSMRAIWPEKTLPYDNNIKDLCFSVGKDPSSLTFIQCMKNKENRILRMSKTFGDRDVSFTFLLSGYSKAYLQLNCLFKASVITLSGFETLTFLALECRFEGLLILPDLKMLQVLEIISIHGSDDFLKLPNFVGSTSSSSSSLPQLRKLSLTRVNFQNKEFPVLTSFFPALQSLRIHRFRQLPAIRVSLSHPLQKLHITTRYEDYDVGEMKNLPLKIKLCEGSDIDIVSIDCRYEVVIV